MSDKKFNKILNLTITHFVIDSVKLSLWHPPFPIGDIGNIVWKGIIVHVYTQRSIIGCKNGVLWVFAKVKFGPRTLIFCNLWINVCHKQLSIISIWIQLWHQRFNEITIALYMNLTCMYLHYVVSFFNKSTNNIFISSN